MTARELKSPAPDPAGMEARLEEAERAYRLGDRSEQVLRILQIQRNGLGCAACSCASGIRFVDREFNTN